MFSSLSHISASVLHFGQGLHLPADVHVLLLLCGAQEYSLHITNTCSLPADAYRLVKGNYEVKAKTRKTYTNNKQSGRCINPEIMFHWNTLCLHKEHRASYTDLCKGPRMM